ncbi:MAG: acyl-CoA dehydrogenase family protein [Deferribacteraceae bacterium]|jgi:butyryl-CoA dehydrogenase|nr:acyl-CoA dehydrogenase family protein [Deferribacteraceae bacterium]
MILSEEHELLREAVREIALKELAPRAEDADHNMTFPAAQLKALAASGMLMIKYPEKYGGAGGDNLASAIVAEETARECLSSSTTSLVQMLSGDCIFLYGTEEQKMKYMPKMATGELLGCFALTEPGAGSDASNMSTVGVDKGDHYLVNGTKTFITNAEYGDFIVAFVKTNPERGARGVTAMILEKGQFQVSKHEDKMGMRASNTCEVVIKDAKVPKENVLGKPGLGFIIAMSALNGGRIGAAAQAVGMMQAMLDESIAYAKQREQFGKPIGSNQAIQWMIADMAKDLNAARQLTYHAAALTDSGKPSSTEASMAKLFATEVGIKHASNAVQIHGGYGYCKPSKVERMYRDIRILTIYEGTSEVQRMVISNNIMK